MSLASLPIGSMGGTQQVKNKSVMFIDNTVSTCTYKYITNALNGKSAIDHVDN